jgi:hypothetical protein
MAVTAIHIVILVTILGTRAIKGASTIIQRTTPTRKIAKRRSDQESDYDTDSDNTYDDYDGCYSNGLNTKTNFDQNKKTTREVHTLKYHINVHKLLPHFTTKAPKFYNIMAFIFLISASITITTSTIVNQQPKHYTIFDAVGEMASGMAYIHVAIPLNLSTFHIQADILGDYLFRLSRVVDNDTRKMDT